jgi:hypothetical protein
MVLQQIRDKVFMQHVEWPKRCIEEMPARIEVRRAEKRRRPARIGVKPIARL